jgi:hypothetical protein
VPAHEPIPLVVLARARDVGRASDSLDSSHTCTVKLGNDAGVVQWMIYVGGRLDKASLSFPNFLATSPEHKVCSSCLMLMLNLTSRVVRQVSKDGMGGVVTPLPHNRLCNKIIGILVLFLLKASSSILLHELQRNINRHIWTRTVGRSLCHCAFSFNI